MPPKKTNRFKRWILLWIWRIQQPGQIFNIVMSAINMTLLVNLYMKWRFENPYVGILLAFGTVMSVLLIVAYLWDAKAKMWHEQIEVSVHKNPYYYHKMTAKEVVGYKKQWVKLMRILGMEEEAVFWDTWCDEQMRDDSVLAEQTRALQEYLREKAKG